ncbi:MAG: RNA polymerase sigma factor, partial [Deltaproteobacteria bacterium]|nr:RNA polymerase sigma factor [Deltaproteobacteria bacterium]
MSAYQAGDMDSFRELYEAHKGRVMGYLHSRLNDQDEAEDVFQQVFLKLHRYRHRYRSEVPFLPWLFTITRNAMAKTAPHS